MGLAIQTGAYSIDRNQIKMPPYNQPLEPTARYGRNKKEAELITEEIKIKGLNHIFYEITQLKLCANAIKERFNRNARAFAKKDEKYYCEKATYAEALLIHTRTLKDFVEGQPKNTDKRDVNDLEKKSGHVFNRLRVPPSRLGI